MHGSIPCPGLHFRLQPCDAAGEVGLYRDHRYAAARHRPTRSILLYRLPAKWADIPLNLDRQKRRSLQVLPEAILKAVERGWLPDQINTVESAAELLGSPGRYRRRR